MSENKPLMKQIQTWIARNQSLNQKQRTKYQLAVMYEDSTRV